MRRATSVCSLSMSHDGDTSSVPMDSYKITTFASSMRFVWFGNVLV